VFGRQPGATFLYGQALFDTALVTAVIHVTGGAESDFASLYILVIAVSAVLLPLTSSLLLTLLVAIAYTADIVWGHPFQLSPSIFLQIGVFLGVALTTGWLGSRVRVVGAEREVLREEVDRLRLEASDILRNIRSGIVTVDAQGLIVYANPAAQIILGLTGEQLVGQPVADAISPRSPVLGGAIAVTLRGGPRLSRAEATVTVDGRATTVGFSTTALDGLGGATAIFTDISQQKRLEELLLRTQRLEAVAELSASLAHEIKNPLASIRSSVEQLSRSARTNDDERFLAQLVLRESDRLSRLLTEFLDFSGVRVTVCRAVDLGQVAAGAVEVVRKHPDCPADLDITVTGEGGEVQGDEDLLHRVVVNLVLNAVQASHDGEARVSIEVRSALPGDLPPGIGLERPVIMRVVDNGPGIPEEIRERIFDPFVSGRVGGSGLGLAIVQRAVMAHRGLVFVDSEPGRGTAFTLLFPGDSPAEAAA
ncbi:MAG TPA: ATP-binding protein, partial [Gemmatimonadales bacterium]|jgi:two-component system sensor histidine kinase PilS (NtrC family)